MSSTLEVGIVGLPNAGKSTLFNALASRRLAETAPRPFTTIDPHEAVVAVPDEKLNKLHNILVSQYPNIELIPATVTFIDIAGLIRGSHKGEGLGNQFLGKIREVNAITHVVRAFTDPAVSHPHPQHEVGTEEQIFDDIEVVNIELELGEIAKKPTIYVLNVDEKEINSGNTQNLIKVINSKFNEPAIAISAKIEEELIDLSEGERKEYLKASGIASSGLEQLIKKSYALLDLITFYTIKGGKEVTAWSLKRGSKAIEAAGVVHTDFAKGFIKAEVINVDELFQVGSLAPRSLGAGVWQTGKEKGKIRL